MRDFEAREDFMYMYLEVHSSFHGCDAVLFNIEEDVISHRPGVRLEKVLSVGTGGFADPAGVRDVACDRLIGVAQLTGHSTTVGGVPVIKRDVT